MNLLSIHKISVLIFLLIYLIKTILLVANQTENLEKFKKLTRILEMIVSTAFLVTGVWMLIAGGSIKMLQIVKIIMVIAAIPIAVIAYKKSNKILAILSLFLIIMAYGLAEMSKNKKPIGVDENGLTSSDPAVMGQAVYAAYCVNCHGDDGKKGFMGALDLSLSTLDKSANIEIITNGKNDMKPNKDILTSQQIDAVADYVQTLKNK